MVVVFVLVLLAVFGGISGAVATSRGHGFWPFFLLGALISPLLAILLVFIIAPPQRAGTRRRGRGRPPQRGRRLPPSRTAVRTPERDANPYAVPTRQPGPSAARATRSYRR